MSPLSRMIALRFTLGNVVVTSSRFCFSYPRLGPLYVFVSKCPNGMVHCFSCFGAHNPLILQNVPFTFLYVFHIHNHFERFKSTSGASPRTRSSSGSPYPTMWHGQRPPLASRWPWAWAALPCHRPRRVCHAESGAAHRRSWCWCGCVLQKDHNGCCGHGEEVTNL